MARGGLSLHCRVPATSYSTVAEVAMQPRCVAQMFAPCFDACCTPLTASAYTSPQASSHLNSRFLAIHIYIYTEYYRYNT